MYLSPLISVSKLISLGQSIFQFPDGLRVLHTQAFEHWLRNLSRRLQCEKLTDDIRRTLSDGKSKQMTREKVKIVKNKQTQKDGSSILGYAFSEYFFLNFV
jgi:hypothetical protein